MIETTNASPAWRTTDQARFVPRLPNSLKKVVAFSFSVRHAILLYWGSRRPLQQLSCRRLPLSPKNGLDGVFDLTAGFFLPSPIFHLTCYFSGAHACSRLTGVVPSNKKSCRSFPPFSPVKTVQSSMFDVRCSKPVNRKSNNGNR